jgi:small subunit ribosomal protein S2
MRPFIFTERNGIHIIDLQQTVRRLDEAMEWVKVLTAEGGSILFVGTKKQAQDAIREEATRAGMPYVCQRWLGGTLTNFQTIQMRIRKLQELEANRDAGGFERLPKKEAIQLEDQITRLNRLLGGIRALTRLPGAMFVVDPQREHIVMAEALRLQIPVVAMADTNCDPTIIDYPVPSNDDAIRAIRLITGRIADAALDGIRIREAATTDLVGAEDVEDAEEVDEDVEIIAPDVALEVTAAAEAAFLGADLEADLSPTAPKASESPATV